MMDVVVPPGGFRVIYADPPWAFAVRSAKGGSRLPAYTTMTAADIMALPVAEIAAKNSVLLMWTTDPFLQAAFDVIRSWGFSYKTVGFYWIKTNRTRAGYFRGTGFWTRANPEQCLLATRGRIGRLPSATDIDKLILAPRREHSRKPDEAYARIERLLGIPSPENPMIEMFARQTWPGWTPWGNQLGTFPVPLQGPLPPDPRSRHQMSFGLARG